MDRLTEIQERLSKATPGPWVYTPMTSHKARSHGGMYFKVECKKVFVNICIYIFKKADAELIAHSPDDIKYLLDQLTALQQENAELRQETSTINKRTKAWREANSALKSERDELKKALELACIRMQGIAAKKGRLTPDYFIQQAKEATGK